MITRIFFILTFSLILTNTDYAFGQERVKTEAVKYLVKVGDLNSIEEKKNYDDCIFIFELLQTKGIEKRKSQIFKFGVDSAHFNTYLLLSDGKKCQILNLHSLDEDLLIITCFLRKCKTF